MSENPGHHTHGDGVEPAREHPASGDGHRHGHDHVHDHGWLARLRHALRPHSHDAADLVDETLEASARGMRALWVSFIGLLATAVAQLVVLAFTGSVALLGDTVHNFADALTAVPLAVAFALGRRAVTRRFTYGLGRSEDLAGLVILLVMAGSAAFTAYEAVERLIHPRELTNLGWVAAAGVVGFVGNEVVARYRIRIGRSIGSAALVADGLHARTDGYTSLAVVLAAIGAGLGWRWADPVIGLLITVAIVSVLWGAAKEVFARMLDAVDPAMVDRARTSLRDLPDVTGVVDLRMRWVGHELHAEVELDVDEHLSLAQGHRVAHEAEHRLLHVLPRLVRATVHAYPAHPRDDTHDLAHRH